MPTDEEQDATREAWLTAVLDQWDRIEWLNTSCVSDHGGALSSDKRAG